jgi:hypothetical protein
MKKRKVKDRKEKIERKREALAQGSTGQSAPKRFFKKWNALVAFLIFVLRLNCKQCCVSDNSIQAYSTKPKTGK